MEIGANDDGVADGDGDATFVVVAAVGDVAAARANLAACKRPACCTSVG